MVLQLQSMNSVKGPPPDESDGEHDEHGEELHQNEAGKRNGVKTRNGEAEPLLKVLRKPSDLQLKLEKQLEKSRKSNQQGKMVARGSLLVPGKGGFTDMRPEEPPLVALHSPSIDEDFEDVALASPDDIIFKQPLSPYKGPEDCTQQLLKDGYRLDELSDDEDLDLILPNRKQTTWCTCDSYCIIQ
eukprot:Seg1758.5 transcript_id=Seg1758.5/GoldUCD/mRNA.D3Y31 product="Protein FAM219A" protein_id=Seg1758.5/GoldUCD/D3Y31